MGIEFNFVFRVFLNNNVNWVFKEKLYDLLSLLFILIRVVGNEFFIVGKLMVKYFNEFDRLNSF